MQAKQRLSYPALESHQDLRFLDIKKCWSCCRDWRRKWVHHGCWRRWVFWFVDTCGKQQIHGMVGWSWEKAKHQSGTVKFWVIFCWMNSFMNAFLGSSMGVETSVPLKYEPLRCKPWRLPFRCFEGRNSKWIWLPQVGLPWPPSLLVNYGLCRANAGSVPVAAIWYLLMACQSRMNSIRSLQALASMSGWVPSAHWGYPPATAPQGVAPHAPGPITPAAPVVVTPPYPGGWPQSSSQESTSLDVCWTRWFNSWPFLVLYLYRSRKKRIHGLTIPKRSPELPGI